MKKILAAIADYNKAIELDPENFMAYNNRGNARNYLRDYDEALLDFDKSLEINSHHNTYFNRGVTKECLNDFENAIEDYNKSLELKNDDVQVLSKRAFAQYKLENYKTEEKTYVYV